MNILNLIGGNWIRRPQTQRYPERQPPAAEYRGNVVNDPSICVACGICAHVCVSAAIELHPAEDSCTWVYDPARCTFCRFCVQHCPVDALSQMPDRGATAHRPGEQVHTTIIEYPRCPECGNPAMPYSETLVERAYGQHAEALRERARLCPDCRRRATGQAMKNTFVIPSEAGSSSHGR